MRTVAGWLFLALIVTSAHAATTPPHVRRTGAVPDGGALAAGSVVGDLPDGDHPTVPAHPVHVVTPRDFIPSRLDDAVASAPRAALPRPLPHRKLPAPSADDHPSSRSA